MLVSKRYDGYVEVNKSKFYAILMPLNNVDDFKALLAEIKKEHSKAKHVVYAYRVGTSSKSNDDQEPKGTAGRPLLELLHKKDLHSMGGLVASYVGTMRQTEIKGLILNDPSYYAKAFVPDIITTGI